MKFKYLILALFTSLVLAVNCGASNLLIHLPLAGDLLDKKSTLAAGEVKRSSAATYINSGVLYTVDGDDTPFSHSSVEDETGATEMRGSFVDGQAWFHDAGGLIAVYAGTGNLLILADPTLNAYGFLGEVGTGEVATPLTNNVTAISKADPGVVSSVAHGLGIGDLVYFDSLNEMVELNTKYMVVTAVGSVDLFSINDTSGYGFAEVTGGACAHEVTEPNASAVKIYKEHGLLNEGWNAIDTGIDYNAGAAWDFDIYVNLMSSAGGTAQPRFEDGWLLVEPEATNWCLYSRDLSNAAWTKTTCTGAKTQIGLDLGANSASLLTATGANATCLQTISLLSTAKTFSAYVKRSVGTGAISITDDDGANYTECTGLSSTAFTQYEITRTQADPVVGFKIATSGDAIIVDYSQLEETGFSTSAIPTTSIPVTRTTEAGSAADNGYSWTITQPLKDILDDAEPGGDPTDSQGTLLFEVKWGCDKSDIGAGNFGLLTVFSSGSSVCYFDQWGIKMSDGLNSSTLSNPSFSAGDIIIYASRWGDVDGNANDISVGLKEAGGAWSFDLTPAAYDGKFTFGTDFRLSFENFYPLHIKDIKFYDIPYTQAELEAGIYRRVLKWMMHFEFP